MKVSRCGCGKVKRRRHKFCAVCFGHMTKGEKAIYEAASKLQTQGSLRRWQ